MPIKEVRIHPGRPGGAGWVEGRIEEAEEGACTSLWWSGEEHTHWPSSRNLEMLSVEEEKPGKVTRKEGAPGHLKGSCSHPLAQELREVCK